MCSIIIVSVIVRVIFFFYTGMFVPQWFRWPWGFSCLSRMLLRHWNTDCGQPSQWKMPDRTPPAALTPVKIKVSFYDFFELTGVVINRYTSLTFISFLSILQCPNFLMWKTLKVRQWHSKPDVLYCLHCILINANKCSK